MIRNMNTKCDENVGCVLIDKWGGLGGKRMNIFGHEWACYQ